jgi:hypothetical protein
MKHKQVPRQEGVNNVLELFVARAVCIGRIYFDDAIGGISGAGQPEFRSREIKGKKLGMVRS